jgi:hypothetical protein
MHIEIRPFADGWAWYLIDPRGGTRFDGPGGEVIAHSKTYVTRHATSESAQRLMIDGVTSIIHSPKETGGEAKPT